MLNVGYLWKAVRFIYSFKYLFLLFYKMCVYVCLWICTDEWRCPQKLEVLNPLEPELHAVMSEPPGMGPLQSCATFHQQALPQTADLFCKVESMKWPQFSLSLNLRFPWNKIYILWIKPYKLVCSPCHEWRGFPCFFLFKLSNSHLYEQTFGSMSNVSRHIIQCSHHPIQ